MSEQETSPDQAEEYISFADICAVGLEDLVFALGVVRQMGCVSALTDREQETIQAGVRQASWLVTAEVGRREHRAAAQRANDRWGALLEAARNLAASRETGDEVTA